MWTEVRDRGKGVMKDDESDKGVYLAECSRWDVLTVTQGVGQMVRDDRVQLDRVAWNIC